MPSSAPKNIFLFYLKIHLIVYILQNKLKKYETFILWLLWNIKTKKYVKYILVYIKIRIVETWKYDLSYIRYYIVIAIRELVIIFWTIRWS